MGLQSDFDILKYGSGDRKRWSVINFDLGLDVCFWLCFRFSTTSAIAPSSNQSKSLFFSFLFLFFCTATNYNSLGCQNPRALGYWLRGNGSPRDDSGPEAGSDCARGLRLPRIFLPISARIFASEDWRCSFPPYGVRTLFNRTESLFFQPNRCPFATSTLPSLKLNMPYVVTSHSRLKSKSISITHPTASFLTTQTDLFMCLGFGQSWHLTPKPRKNLALTR